MHDTQTLICDSQTCHWEGENYLWRIDKWAKKEARESQELRIKNESDCEVAVEMEWKAEEARAWLDKIEWQVVSGEEVLIREKVSEATGAGKINVAQVAAREEKAIKIELLGREEIEDEVQGERWGFDIEVGAEVRNCGGRRERVQDRIERQTFLSPASAPFLPRVRLDAAVGWETPTPLDSRSGARLKSGDAPRGQEDALAGEMSHQENSSTISSEEGDFLPHLTRIPYEWVAWSMAIGLLILVKFCPLKTRDSPSRQ